MHGASIPRAAARVVPTKWSWAASPLLIRGACGAAAAPNLANAGIAALNDDEMGRAIGNTLPAYPHLTFWHFLKGFINFRAASGIASFSPEACSAPGRQHNEQPQGATGRLEAPQQHGDTNANLGLAGSSPSPLARQVFESPPGAACLEPG